MKKLISVLCSLLLLLTYLPAVAENTISPEVQTFFEHTDNVLNADQVVYAAD